MNGFFIPYSSFQLFLGRGD